MATNNAINLKDAGIVSYDGAGTFSSVGNPLTVANGGTTNSSLTAYTVLCGGTTSTNPIQPISSVGVSGQMLTSNGAGALPSFQGGTGQYVLKICTSSGSSVTDGATYFVRAFDPLNTSTVSGNSAQRLYIPKTGSITGCYGFLTLTGGTAENVTISIRVNNSTDHTVTSTLQLNNSTATFSNTSLGIAVSAGDYIEIKFASPTWVTNPSSVAMTVTVYLI